MKPFFSIIILTLNGEKTIGQLLNKLTKLTDNYNKEIIIIDSESVDNTISIVNSFYNKLNIRIKRIKKRNFNHGITRNMAVEMAYGKFIYFLSQDAIPLSKKILKYYVEDFKLDNKIVAVFGKHIPYKNTPIIQKLEVVCRWERLDKLVNKKNILIQNKQKLLTLYKNINLLDLYVLSNTSCCYRKDFLIKNPFPKITYGEDLIIGKKIIDMGLSKVYDVRCSVSHSHTYSIKQYFLREKEDLRLRLSIMGFKTKSNFLCKLKKIVFLDCSIILKIKYIVKLIFYYFLKILILINLKIYK